MAVNNIIGRAEVSDALLPEQTIQEIIQTAPESSVILVANSVINDWLCTQTVRDDTVQLFLRGDRLKLDTILTRHVGSGVGFSRGSGINTGSAISHGCVPFRTRAVARMPPKRFRVTDRERTRKTRKPTRRRATKNPTGKGRVA